MRRIAKLLSLSLPALLSVGVASAQEAAPAVTPEVAFIFNSFLFLVAGMVVMFMAAGFCMLEVGLVRSKNAATICLKNISLFAIAGIMFWLIGYNITYPGEFNGVFGFAGAFWGGAGEADLETGYAASSDWYFQMVFVATAASIVSGTLAERIKLWPFLAFVAVLTGVIYPVQASWEWGAGWLDGLGFSDFAGSTLVHSTGGWAALMGALFLGAREGKYGKNGEVAPFPGSNLPLATLGTFILWLGWFGFNGGSVLALGTVEAATQVSDVFIKTNLAAAAGVLVAVGLSQVIYGRVILPFALNGAIGGLVAITAEPLMPSMPLAAFIGGVGGAIVVGGVPLLDKLKIDDVVGAIPAHLFAGIWGTMVVPLSNPDASFGVQFLGVIAIGAFVSAASAIVWAVLKYTSGIRSDVEHERDGLDMGEMGLSAYPEWPSDTVTTAPATPAAGSAPGAAPVGA
ncbi:ammonium transporter [Parvularcula sp. ZS-1/3]|uniref:Ammonium transporter n=1 Tax=Parvularcula mediterranea TaxID=2732508 RepID=A0A7Y3W619_9PROT|nr:ammonium transporter [Parvularcula mediterranea]NNU17229.1 ammonium transporter [Parvularcula mediterranea]